MELDQLDVGRPPIAAALQPTADHPSTPRIRPGRQAAGSPNRRSTISTAAARTRRSGTCSAATIGRRLALAVGASRQQTQPGPLPGRRAAGTLLCRSGIASAWVIACGARSSTAPAAIKPGFHALSTSKHRGDRLSSHLNCGLASRCLFLVSGAHPAHRVAAPISLSGKGWPPRLPHTGRADRGWPMRRGSSGDLVITVDQQLGESAHIRRDCGAPPRACCGLLDLRRLALSRSASSLVASPSSASSREAFQTVS